MDEFAPEYTEKEKIIFFLKTLAWALPLFSIVQFALIPSLIDFSDHAHCVSLLGMTGFELIFFGLFMGIPFSIAIIFALTIGRRALKVIKTGQTPPPKEKVFRRTKIIYGEKAKLRGYLALCCLLALVILASFGYVPAKGFLSNIGPTEFPPCISPTGRQGSDH